MDNSDKPYFYTNVDYIVIDDKDEENEKASSSTSRLSMIQLNGQNSHALPQGKKVKAAFFTIRGRLVPLKKPHVHQIASASKSLEGGGKNKICIYLPSTPKMESCWEADKKIIDSFGREDKYTNEIIYKTKLHKLRPLLVIIYFL